jgi:hypothetical protein
MAVTTFSPLLGLALPTTGDLSGTWGATVNDAITSLLDSAVAGTTTLSTDASVTLTTTNGASNQARSSVLLCTGARTGVKVITAPAQSKAYVVINSTTGGYAVTLVGVGPSTPGVTVVAGEKCLAAWNGSDFVKVASSVPDVAGPASSTDNAFTRFDGTTGKLIQNSTATLSDTGAPTFTGSVTVAGTSASGASIVLGEDTDNGVNTITLQAPSTLAADLALTLPTADGTSGQFLSTNGSGQLSFQSQSSGNVITNTQTFTSSGTWTKPSGANWVQVVIWGAGASGSNTVGTGSNRYGVGGGGGAYVSIVFAASSLSSTVTVTVGAGGTVSAYDFAGNNGGTSSFGSYATAPGGYAGGTGGAGTITGGFYGGTNFPFGNGYADAAGGGLGYSSGYYVVGTGGVSIFGGGGGGSAGGSSFSAGGTSTYGGAGGAGAYSGAATAGTQPGGGGGGSSSAGLSGAGGAGQCVVYTW